MLATETWWRNNVGLGSVLAKIRSGNDDEIGALAVGESWDLGSGLWMTFVSKPSESRSCCRLLATATTSATEFPPSLSQNTTPVRRVALCDFVARQFQKAILASSSARAHGLRFISLGPYCLETNWVTLCKTTSSVRVLFEIERGSSCFKGKDEQSRDLAETILQVLKRALLSSNQPGGGLEVGVAMSHVQCIEDQRYLRQAVTSSDGICFIANGSVLPRRSGYDDAPMDESRGMVPFESPLSLRREFVLPHRGAIAGMLVPRGITVIVGGGYHGKSTILRAIAVGVYDKIPGDGREFVVSDPGTVTVRAEDGRPVSGLDISAFISALPAANRRCVQKVTPDIPVVIPSGGSMGGGESVTQAIDDVNECGDDNAKDGNTNSTTQFSTTGASGSTSQAANVMEALEAGAMALLLDEDTCAGNFMIRDSRMRAMVSHEPITPFIYRVTSLWQELGVSSIVVVGGCGDYFDIHDTAILVDNYVATDVTERAHSMSRRFCVGRVQYAGRGLVHRLPWPGNPSPRTVVPESIPGVLNASNSKRKQANTVRVPAVGTLKRRSMATSPTSTDTIKDGRLSSAAEIRDGEVLNGVSEAKAAERAGRDGCRDKNSSSGGVNEDSGAGATIASTLRCTCPPCSCGATDGGQSTSFSTGTSGRMVRLGNTIVDLSRVEQLVGGVAQARGCALGVEWVARATERWPRLSLTQVLDKLDEALREGEGGGLTTLVELVKEQGVPDESLDLVARPRKFEVAAVLHRLPGVRFASADDSVRMAGNATNP